MGRFISGARVGQHCALVFVAGAVTLGWTGKAWGEPEKQGDTSTQCKVAEGSVLDSLVKLSKASPKAKVAKAKAKPKAPPMVSQPASAPASGPVVEARGPDGVSIRYRLVPIEPELAVSEAASEPEFKTASFAEPVPGEEPIAVASDDGAEPVASTEPGAEETVVPVESAVEPEAISAPTAAEEPAAADEAAPVGAAVSPVAPAAAPPAEEPAAASTTVMGAVVLGLLPYTVAEGAFGIGSSVGMDKLAEDAGVSFGPSATLGVTDWLTLGAAVPFASSPMESERVTGLGNVGLSAQFAFYSDTDSGITLAATPGVALPAPSEAAASTLTPDVKASGAVNFGAVAMNLTARGRVDVPTEEGDAVPGVTSALSLILVNETIAPFVEGAVDVSGESVLPMGSAGVNWAPGGGALLTLGVPVVFDGESVNPGMAFTAYFETSLWGGGADVARSVATPFAVK
jgi:hypothetical protein